MKFDMHCHTHEGSPDSSVSIEEYARILISQGFDGMLVTDHDSYDGYRFWSKNLKDKNEFKDFVVLRGIEYDTFDAGHFIIILPMHEEPRLFEKKGLSLRRLIKIVHRHGGILGPAHPFGEKFLSIYNTGIFKKHTSITSSFDFIEGFNSCEDQIDNDKAKDIARMYDKACFAGSDSHKSTCVGTAITEIDANIKNENDLIRYIKNGNKPTISGKRWIGTIKDHLGPFNKFLVYGFFFYNKYGALKDFHGRKKEIKLFNERFNILKDKIINHKIH